MAAHPLEGSSMLAACILFVLPTIKETWVNADRHPVYSARTRVVAMDYIELSHVRDELAAKYAEEEKIAEEMIEANVVIQNGGQAGLPPWLFQNCLEVLDLKLTILHQEMDRLDGWLREMERSLLPVY